MTANRRTLRLVAVIGATGTGKSDLAMRIARECNGEIINADAVQLYKGLDIPCNKVTTEERARIPHHLLDMLSPTEEWTVLDYKAAAEPIIADICSRGRVPILCGGTNYYIQALLWPSLLGDTASVASSEGRSNAIEKKWDAEDCKESTTESSICGLLEVPNELNSKPKTSAAEAYRRLQMVDPTMASRLHPANLRKVLRSLEVYDTMGRRHSDLISEQQEANLSMPPRYDACIFWIDCDKDTLGSRLDGRVSKMMKRGMLEEIRAFHELLCAKNHPFDFTKGILQAIGFKEFARYLELKECSDEEREKVLQSCVEAVQLSTRRYAKRQLTWIRNRTLSMKPAIPIYRLDGANLTNWDENVVIPAIDVTRCLINGEALPLEKRSMPLSEDNAISPELKHAKHVCEACARTLHGYTEWRAHLDSRGHKRTVAKQARRVRGDAIKT